MLEYTFRENDINALSVLLARSQQISPRILLTRVLPATQTGDLAIAQANLLSLRDQWPKAEIDLMCRLPDQDAPHFSAADRVLPEPLSTGSDSIFDTCLALAGRFMSYSARTFEHVLSEADLLLFCGGGSPGGYGFGNLVKHAMVPARAATRAGVPYAFTGLGLHSYQNPIHRRFHAQVLGGAALVTVRDPLSYDQLLALSPRGQTALTADWAWLLQPIDEVAARALLLKESDNTKGRLRIGLNLRSDRAVNPESKRDVAGATTTLIREAIPPILEQTDGELYVFSMNAPPASDDRAYAGEVLGALESRWRRRIHLLRGDYTPAQTRGMIGTMDMFVGTRLHPSLFAASMGVPVLALHDHDKVRGFMQHIDQDSWHLPLTGLDVGTLLKKFFELHACAGAVSSGLKRSTIRMEQLARSNLEHIDAVIEAHTRGRQV